ncbi:MAG: ROK family protein [Verrucomicrobia bacterium]|nr:ROK family protein [Verrucomicrobiota bacterium]MBV9272714.1 ROK family protein [Verrucomicrobiota bacterium]
MSALTAIGFDFGATTIKTGVVRDGVILEKGNVIETRQDGDTGALIGEMIKEIQSLKSRYPEVVAVGFGVPGIIDPVKGMVIRLTNVTGWSDIPLRATIQSATGLTTNLENDAKAMAYAEWKHGAGAQVPNVVCVTLGTAVGGALILNGKLYRGANFVAGEIGQMSIDYQGVDFVYGNKGALEAYVGHFKIAERAKEIYAAAGKTINDEEADPKNLSAAADRGDALAEAVWKDIGLKLGVGLINVIWLVNPHRIVLGGGVSQAGERLFGHIRETIRTRCAKTFWERLEIVSAALGNDAGIIGAATLALESEFLPAPLALDASLRK